MMQMAFTAQELYCMAYLQGKHKMYGIPNAMVVNREKQIQEAINSLLAQNLATMDIDGNISLDTHYHTIVDFYCDCQKCLAVTLQKENQKQRLIIWKYDDQYMMAEVVGIRYVFSSVDETMVRDLLNGVLYCEDICCNIPEAIVPQIQLKKAKRLCCNENIDEAIRLLRQNGVGEDMAGLIVDVLLEKAYCLGLIYMDMQSSPSSKTEKMFLAGNNILLSVGTTKLNLRSCATFQTISLPEMHKDYSQIVNSFVKEGVLL